MLWLRRLDKFAYLVPRQVLRICRRAASTDKICLLRPGGVGDLVILTRALLERGLHPNDFCWFVERRNSIWLDYLRIPYLCYDRPAEFFAALRGKYSHNIVINTEQTFGLSTLFAARLVAADGKLVGYSSNIRKDCLDLIVDYQLDGRELVSFAELLDSSLEGSEIEKGSGFIVPEAGEREISTEPYVAVAIGGLQANYKRLDLSWWAAFVRMASKESGCKVLLLGAPIDLSFSTQLQSEVGNKLELENYVGRIPFSEAVDAVRRAGRLYSVDSGLVHVADFFGVPTTVVFPAGNHRKWRPSHGASQILDPSFSCLREA